MIYLMTCHQPRQVFRNRYRKWNKTIWIAKKIGKSENDYGYETALYAKPEKYKMNVQPVNSSADIQEFGERAKQMQKAVVKYKKYFNEFKEFDVAYLDGANPEEETENNYGKNANYRLYPPRNQNKCITIYFEKISSE